MSEPMNILVLDLGSTHLKASVVSPDLDILFETHKDNIRIQTDAYEALNTSDIGDFIFKAIADTVDDFAVKDIIISSHGSSLALLDYDDDEKFSPFAEYLAMPVMFYGQEIPLHIQEAYRQQAPQFLEVFSEITPLALTGAMQIFWQSNGWPHKFKFAKKIVMWPSYWAFRLSGKAYNDYSSLGAQNQIWNPLRHDFSSVIKNRGWASLFAPAKASAEKIGVLHPDICKKYQLKNRPQILCGVHDSNANYWRFVKMGLSDASIISTGTWIVNFNPHFDPIKLEGKADCCTNTTVTGQPISCSRYQGGLELSLLLKKMGDIDINMQVSFADIKKALSSHCLILPSFASSGGPVPHTEAQGKIIGKLPNNRAQRYVLAVLYITLMIQLSWEYIDIGKKIIIDGPFTKNPLFLQLMAALNPNSDIYISTETNGTLLGAALLSEDTYAPSPHSLSKVELLKEYDDISASLKTYKEQWFCQLKMA